MVVTVHALFSHNKMIGSRVIAEGTHHLAPKMPKISHVAVLINGRWVHEATGSGVHIVSYDKWQAVHTEVARVQLQDKEYQVIADQFRLIKDKKYDYPGVLFLALAIIPTFIGLPLPKKNLWHSKNKYFCCEVLGFLTDRDYSMAAPVQILDSLSGG